MPKKRYFQRLYKFEESSKTYIIEVSLDNYDDVYDDWDPSPFKKRDIEVEFNDFILNSSEDIPLKHSISIVLYLPVSKKDEIKETTLIAAYRNYYNYAIERLQKVQSSLNQKTASYLLLSILLLSIGSFFFKEDQGLGLKVLHEGVFIGGWVFLWEFFTNIFIKTREAHFKYKLYKRLHQSEIRFVYYE